MESLSNQGNANHASDVLYPAIKAAMDELQSLHPGFSMEVNRAFNHLHGAFWSECPAPASAAQIRPAMVAFFAVYRGWVLSILWGWFAVSLLGLPPLSIPAAIGIALIVSMLTGTTAPKAEKGGEWTTFFSAALAPLFALLIGWVAKQYI